MSGKDVAMASQIVPSGEALRMAQKWLGVSSLEEALAADPPEDPTLSQPRPPGLGLGADPRKHGKMLHVTSAVERKLGQRLTKQQAGAVQPARKGEASTAGTAGGSPGTDASDVESGDDEEGRAQAIKKKQRPAAQQPGWPQPSIGKGKKRKRKRSEAGVVL